MDSPPHRSVPEQVLRRVARTVLSPPGAPFARVVPRTARFLAGSWERGRRTPVFPDPPAARPSPALAAQVAIDEVFLALFTSPARFPRRADWLRMADEIDAAGEMFGRTGWDEDPAGYHRSPPPLDDPVVEERVWMGQRYEHLRFPSGYRPWPGEPGADRWTAAEANRTAHAYAIRHPDGRPRPWLVCVHGFSTGSPWQDFPAFKVGRLHQMGVNLLLPVLPLHGPRRSVGLRVDDMLGLDTMNVLHGLSQAVWDIRRLISWVRSQAATRVGLYGLSMGGCTTALVASLEGDLDVAIAGIPATDLPRLLAHHCPPHIRRRAVESGVLGQQARRLQRPVSPLGLAPLVPRERRFIYAGLGDRMAPPRQAQELWLHWDQPAMAWYPGNHVGFLWSRIADRFVRDALGATGFLANGEAAPSADGAASPMVGRARPDGDGSGVAVAVAEPA